MPLKYLSLLSEVAGDKRYACDLHHVESDLTSEKFRLYIWKLGSIILRQVVSFVLYSHNYIILITVLCSSR